MSAAEQQAKRRESQNWCKSQYDGEVRSFLDAQCKLTDGHTEPYHRTWRKYNEGIEVLILQWFGP